MKKNAGEFQISRRMNRFTSRKSPAKAQTMLPFSAADGLLPNVLFAPEKSSCGPPLTRPALDVDHRVSQIGYFHLLHAELQSQIRVCQLAVGLPCVAPLTDLLPAQNSPCFPQRFYLHNTYSYNSLI
jgi:hypothetical protein